MTDVQVTCFRCKTSFTVDAETKRAVCPGCGAIGRWLDCQKCQTVVDVWAKHDRGHWQFVCPHCRFQQWWKVSASS
jgi:DNA-directed RNA polymerase subunit RPC12/RpoP